MQKPFLLLITVAVSSLLIAWSLPGSVPNSVDANAPLTTPTRELQRRVGPGTQPTPADDASPTAVPDENATGAVVASGTISITLGEGQQLFHEDKPDALGMKGIPDQPLTPMLQPDKTYRLFIVGGIIGGIRGSTGLMSTKDFMTYSPIVGSKNETQSVITPSCRADSLAASCKDNFDANYAGAGLVFPSIDGKQLFMIYQGTTTNLGDTSGDKAFYSVVALATSTDNGASWTRVGPIITGTDPKPTTNPKPGANGADQSGAIVADGSVYDFYPYFPSRGTGGPTIQVARAPLPNASSPEAWTKYYNGAFGTQSGLGGLGSPIVPATEACSRPAQPWLTFSTYLNQYVMVFICQQGWFFATSSDLVTWTTPTQFYTELTPMFANGQPTDENVSLVTPGNPGQVIGATGYVLYASTQAWGKTAHMLWMRPFTSTKSQ